jgi:hypothetical protein
MDVVPNENLEIFFDEILAAPTTEALIVGLYDVALPALRHALKRHIEDTNPLTDHPSVRVCKFAMIECDEMIEFGRRAIDSLGATAKPQAAEQASDLRDVLSAAGGISGVERKSDRPVQRKRSVKPYEYDPVPRRDARFIDPYNRGVNAEAFLYDETMPENAKVLMMFFKRLPNSIISSHSIIANLQTRTDG